MNVKEKLLSGRYFITICCGLVFIYCSVKKTLPEEAIIAVIMYVVQAYFSKAKEGGNGGEKEEAK